MKRTQSTLLHLFALLMVTNVSALEPLKDSTELAMTISSKRTIEEADKNKDGRIQKEEDERLWRRKARYDKDGDGRLDLEEFKQIPDPQVDSPGKKLLNVIFKRTPQGRCFSISIFRSSVEARTNRSSSSRTEADGRQATSRRLGWVPSMTSTRRY